MSISERRGKLQTLAETNTAYTLEEAGTLLTEIWCGTSEDLAKRATAYRAFVSEIEEAVAGDQLAVRSPVTGLPWRDREWYLQYNVFHATDLARWVEAKWNPLSRASPQTTFADNRRSINPVPFARCKAKDSDPEARKTRLRARKEELLAQNVKAWLTTIAREEGVSNSRVKVLLRPPDVAESHVETTTPKRAWSTLIPATSSK